MSVLDEIITKDGIKDFVEMSPGGFIAAHGLNLILPGSQTIGETALNAALFTVVLTKISDWTGFASNKFWSDMLYFNGKFHFITEWFAANKYSYPIDDFWGRVKGGFYEIVDLSRKRHHAFLCGHHVSWCGDLNIDETDIVIDFKTSQTDISEFKEGTKAVVADFYALLTMLLSIKDAYERKIECNYKNLFENMFRVRYGFDPQKKFSTLIDQLQFIQMFSTNFDLQSISKLSENLCAQLINILTWYGEVDGLFGFSPLVKEFEKFPYLDGNVYKEQMSKSWVSSDEELDAKAQLLQGHTITHELVQAIRGLNLREMDQILAFATLGENISINCHVEM